MCTRALFSLGMKFEDKLIGPQFAILLCFQGDIQQYFPCLESGAYVQRVSEMLPHWKKEI